MTWPPQTPDLNLTEMVWDELDHSVKAKQPTSAQHLWELLLQTIPADYLMKLIEECSTVNKAKGGYFEEYKI